MALDTDIYGKKFKVPKIPSSLEAVPAFRKQTPEEYAASFGTTTGEARSKLGVTPASAVTPSKTQETPVGAAATQQEQVTTAIPVQNTAIASQTRAGIPVEGTRNITKLIEAQGRTTYTGVGTGISADQQERDAEMQSRGMVKDQFGNWTPPGGYGIGAAQPQPRTGYFDNSAMNEPKGGTGLRTGTTMQDYANSIIETKRAGLAQREAQRQAGAASLEGMREQGALKRLGIADQQRRQATAEERAYGAEERNIGIMGKRRELEQAQAMDAIRSKLAALPPTDYAGRSALMQQVQDLSGNYPKPETEQIKETELTPSGGTREVTRTQRVGVVQQANKIAPAGAIADLKANPALADAFKAKYGYLP